MPPAQASAEAKQLAQDRYLAGAKLYESGRLAEALAEFRASYDVVASPNSHLMIARAMRDAGDLAGAYDELVRVETEAHEMAKQDPKYAEAVAKASADRIELRAKLGLVTVRVSGAGAAARVTVAGHELPWERWGEPVPVAPGALEVTGIVGDRKVSRTTAVPAGGAVEVELDLGSQKAPPLVAPPPVQAISPASSAADAPAPLSSTPRRESLLPYVAAAGGVGLAGMVVFAVAGAMNHSTFGGLKDGCPGSVCTADRQADIDRGRSEQTVANVGLVIGLVGLGAGATLFVIDRRQAARGSAASPSSSRATPDPHRSFGADGALRPEPHPAPNPHQAFGADVSLRAGPGSIVLGGTF